MSYRATTSLCNRGISLDYGNSLLHQKATQTKVGIELWPVYTGYRHTVIRQLCISSTRKKRIFR